MAEEEQEEKTDLEKEEEAAEQEVADLEDDPPENLEDWPDGAAKYKTLGGAEGDTGYEEGPTSELGESNVRHHEDGTVTVGGEEVDNPDDYKGDPIPGGPTDPNAADPEGLKNDDGESESDAQKDDDADDD